MYLNILCLSFQIYLFTCIHILLIYLINLRHILFKFTYSFVFVATILLCIIIILCQTLVKFTHSLWFVFYISAFFVLYFLSLASLNSPIFVNILYTLMLSVFSVLFFIAMIAVIFSFCYHFLPDQPMSCRWDWSSK